MLNFTTANAQLEGRVTTANPASVDNSEFEQMLQARKTPEQLEKERAEQLRLEQEKKEKQAAKEARKREKEAEKAQRKAEKAVLKEGKKKE